MATVAVVGQAFTFGAALFSQADTKLLQVAPTIAAADFLKSINGGALVALDNTPTVTPAGGVRVQIILSAAETTAAAAGGEIEVYWQDAVGAQWCSDGCLIPVHAAEPSVANIVAGVWAAGARTLTSFGTLVADMATAVWAAGARTLTSFGTLVADVAAAVWDVLTATLTTAGSIGKYILDKLGLISAAGITVNFTGPVVEGGSVVTYRGDSYLNADGRALDWESSAFPTLTGAAISVIIHGSGAGPFVGSVAAADKARLELTAAQSATIPKGEYQFQVVATLDTLVATLVEESWVSNDRAEV